MATKDSFPGIGDEDNITVSPETIFTSLCSFLDILTRALVGSPWVPVAKRIILLAGSFFASFNEINMFGSAFRYPILIAILRLLLILRPTTATLRSCLYALSNTICILEIKDAKVATIILPGA